MRGKTQLTIRFWDAQDNSKKLDAPYRSGAVENLDQNQKSEGGGGNAGYRRKLLIVTDMTLDPNTSSAVRSV